MRKLLLGAALALAVPTVAHAVEGPVPEVPYDCKRWPPRTQRWKAYGYSICMNGPGWQRVKIRCFHPQAGQIYFVYGYFVRSHQVNPTNDLSIEWCPRGSYARRVRIQRLPEIEGFRPRG